MKSTAVATVDASWHTVLHQATRSYDLGEQPVAVSVSTRLAGGDPLHLFAHSDQSDAFYWVSRDRHTVMASSGVAWRVTSAGADRFQHARQTVQNLRFISHVAKDGSNSSAVGPRFYGGFAFAPDPSQPPGPWEAFPDGLLILPEFLLVRHDDETWLTQSVVLHAGADPSLLAQDLEIKRAELLRYLRAEGIGHSSSAPIVQPNGRAPDAWFRLDEPDPEQWACSVEHLTRAAREEGVTKTVLARSMRVQMERPLELTSLLERLREEHPQSFVFALAHEGHVFVGATPERLVRVDEERVFSEALAGSIARGQTPEEDEALAQKLLASEKDRREQDIVRRWVVERLTPWCRQLDAASSPIVRRFPKVQHLYTPVAGRLNESTHILELVQTLHPTPAVGGYPLHDALRLIAAHETQSRGWYAGPIGWLTAAGEGEFAVGIRSAVLSQNDATLYAGCGIVDGSDPMREFNESRLKMQVMLETLVRAFS